MQTRSDATMQSHGNEQEHLDPAPIRRARQGGLMPRLDAWMAENPWHPRITPEMVYLLILLVSTTVAEYLPLALPAVLAVQAAVVLALLWRYRKLTPELTLTFHWSAVPVAALVTVEWIWLGKGMAAWFPETFGDPGTSYFARMPEPLAWTTMAIKLFSMAVVVALFEELFNRSLLLRSLHNARATVAGLVNLLQEMPILEDLLRNTKLARRAARHEEIFGPQFEQCPLGRLTLFGVVASSFIFMLVHGLRDWPAAFICGVIFCLHVWYTNRGETRLGLGPVIWAHGLTNAALWIYTLYTGDWMFMA